jgi:hypothetical protein
VGIRATREPTTLPVDAFNLHKYGSVLNRIYP